MNNNEKFITYSLNIASYIRMCGYEVEVIEDEKGMYYFSTENNEEVKQAVREYKKDKSLHLYLEQFKYLKKEISNLRSN